jgi:hypothetical protein
MKNLILFTLLLLFALSHFCVAQQPQSKKPTEQITILKQEKMIMSFAKPEKMFRFSKANGAFRKPIVKMRSTIKANGVTSIDLIYPKSEQIEERKYTTKFSKSVSIHQDKNRRRKAVRRQG